jgi:sirohydrochlorin cobaltochelatase
MPAKNLTLLTRLLGQGNCFIGEICVSGRYVLTHREDGDVLGLHSYHDPYDAVEIARYDDEGRFRPLKTAPNLRRGWKLELKNIEDVLFALDAFYPAVVGTVRQFEASGLEVVPLRETLERQSGMYAVVKKISDEQADELITKTCNRSNGCLKKILWPICTGRAASLSVPASAISISAQEIPLLCAEACNLLVAAGRKVVKAQDKHS